MADNFCGYWFRDDTQYSGSAEINIVDSFQLWHGETPVQYADSALLTRIVAGFYVLAFDASTHDTTTGNLILTFSGNAGDVYGGDRVMVTISGDYHENIHRPIEGHDSLGLCLVRGTLASEAQDVVADMWDVVIDDLYPMEGKYLESGMIYIDPPDPEDDVESGNPWSSSRTFDEEYISTTVYQNESNKWTVADTLDQVTR